MNTTTMLARGVLLLLAFGGSAACGSSGTSASPPTPAVAASSPTPAPFVMTRPGSVAGVSKAVFTDPGGMTLYYESTDVSGKIQCSGACAAIWPPLLAPAGLTTLPAVFAVPGKFTVVTNPDQKSQITYNGWPLFAFSKDTKPGDQTGEGVAGRWHVASTDLAPNF
jgi:predicted lipoprotein with Yx(FWY)xxD motif